MELVLLRCHLRHRQRHRGVDISDDEIGPIALDQLDGFLDAGGNVILDPNDGLHRPANNAAALIDFLDGGFGSLTSASASAL